MTSEISKRPLFPRISRKVEHIVKSTALYNRQATRERARELQQRDVIITNNRRHLVEALDWIRRAQDATPDHGVSRAYGLEWTSYFGRMGWQESYPETTGYIIPTFFDCAHFLGDTDLSRRAVEMADWEIEVQLPDGAVRGGIIGDPPSPAVFNTGQVILGWLRAHEETREQRFLDAASRAAAFLRKQQDSGGSWKRANSQFALGNATTYNARVGWALIRYGQVTRDDAAIDAGCRNLDHTVTLQTDTGWFKDNCLSDPSAPYTHTISYVLEGLLGGYETTGDHRYLQAVLKAADGILPAIDSSGRLFGKLDSHWKPKASWVCLTGNCQLACIFFRLALIDAAIGSAKQYRSAANRLLTFVKGTQNLVTETPGLRGGIKGSYPVDGAYGRFQLLNWAAKFFVDALLLAEAKANENPQEATQRRPFRKVHRSGPQKSDSAIRWNPA